MPADCKYQFSKNLFWDIDLNTLDMEKNSPYVIQRTLDPKALAYLSVITHTPKTEFRCYNNKMT